MKKNHDEPVKILSERILVQLQFSAFYSVYSQSVENSLCLLNRHSEVNEQGYMTSRTTSDPIASSEYLISEFFSNAGQKPAEGWFFVQVGL